METLQGKASNVRNTVSINGGGNDSQVSTTHIALFQLNGRQVKAKSSEPIMVNEGDEVLVCGGVKSGVFNALAYRNLTTSAEGNEGWMIMMLFGIVFPAISMIVVSAFSNPFFGFIPSIIASVFFLVGFFFLYKGIRVMQATGVIKQYGR